MINPTILAPLVLPPVALEQRSQLPDTACVYLALDGQDKE